MKNPLSVVLLFLIVIISVHCGKPAPTRDQVFATTLPDVRLGDGVPLNIQLSLRWSAENRNSFASTYGHPDSFQVQVLQPRSEEIAKNLAHRYPKVDSVFHRQRLAFIADLKENLQAAAGEPGISIKEVLISDLGFPSSYLEAMELSGLQQQELDRIRQKNIQDLEQADANRKKAEAMGKVAIAEAEAEGKLQKIKAQTEESRRASEVARAETEAQIHRREAQADAERERLLAKADLDKQTDLKNLDIQKQRELDQLEVEKQKMKDRAAFEKDLELAKVLETNPTFGTFLINKELAGKVEIAVLPAGSDPNVLGNLLKQTVNKGRE